MIVQTHVASQDWIKLHKKGNFLASCYKIFTRKASLDTHILSIHENVRFDCVYCDKTFATKFAQNQHIEVKHKGKVFKCNECPYEVTTKHSLKYHMRKHSSEPSKTNITNKEIFQCPECDLDYASKTTLNHHISNIHRNIRYPCNHCNHQARSRHLLKLH